MMINKSAYLTLIDHLTTLNYIIALIHYISDPFTELKGNDIDG